MKTLFGRLSTAIFLLISACQLNTVSEGKRAAASPPALTPITGHVTASPSPRAGSGTEGFSMPELTIVPDPNAQRLVQLAKESLARKFKINVDQIHLSSVQAVTWPDASLGCPQPGVLYAQVMTPGFQILLEAIGQAFTYHTDAKDRVILCDVRPPDEIFMPP